MTLGADLGSLAAFQAWQARSLGVLEAELSQHLYTAPSSPSFASPTTSATPANLGESMAYAVLGGGKRVRALLCLATAQTLGGSLQDTAVASVRAACALELIHAYSLVHDDMPCMDNDVLRRGKPTVHVAFGQAQALLAGDALQALAFELLTPEHGVAPAVQAKLCARLARASGVFGMAGGQALDLAGVGQALDLAALRRMHELKTGALLAASVMMGLDCAALPSSPAADAVAQHLHTYGQAVGLAFQVVDDILDATQSAEQLGKTAGKDAAHNKPTYVSLMGLEAAQRHADGLLAEALGALQALRQQPCAAMLVDPQALDYLGHLAELIVSRSS